MTTAGLGGRADGSRLGATFSALLVGTGVSNLSDGVLAAALPLVMHERSQDALLVSLLFVALSLPHLLFGLPVGTLIDATSKTRILQFSLITRFLCLAGLVALGTTGPLLLFYLAAFVLGCAEAAVDNTAESAVPRLVRTDQLTRANGRIGAVEITTGGFIGPPLGGLLFSVGAVWPLVTAGLAYLVSLVPFLRLPDLRPTTRSKASLWAQMAEGLAIIARTPGLIRLSLIGGTANAAYTGWTAAFVLYALRPGPLGMSSIVYSTLLAAAAVGSVIGSLVTDRFAAKVGTKWTLLAALAGWTVWFAGPLLTKSLVLIYFLIIVGSVFGSMWNVAVRSSRQAMVPPEMLGRVTAAYRIAARGGRPVGAIIGGLIGSAFGSGSAMGVAAGVVGALVLLVLVSPRSAIEPHSATT